VEPLEDRTVPASFTATDVSGLIAAIDAANRTPEADVIDLVAGKTYPLTQVNNNVGHGTTGLPTVAAGEDLTILGNGATIERSTARKTPAFRLFDVAVGASLTLQDLTLQHGWAWGRFGSAQGGAIYNQGTLTLSGVTVQDNTAQGDFGGKAAGGGIWSSGSLTIEHSLIQYNQALGGDGTTSSDSHSPGGWAAGGGIYVSGGAASLIDVTLFSNTARGGAGANATKVYLGPRHFAGWIPGTPGGNGLGGALYAGAGTVSLFNTTVTRNSAAGGSGGSSPQGLPKASDGVGQGGGLYLAPASSVWLDVFTQANVTNNSPDDIFGSYVLF
jgi:hypothetical protein